MREMDHTFNITASELINTLDEAINHLDRVHPEDLREPLKLWFRATIRTACSQRWGANLLGRPVVTVYNAARAILDQPSTKDSSKWVVDPHRDFGPRPRPNSQENNR